MSAHNLTRRHVLKAAAVASTFSLLPHFALAGEPDEERTSWFRAAKFGMFIHWGPYSVASVEASWPIMLPNPKWNITEAEYRSLPKRFNPTGYSPDHFIDLARMAGQQYMVITTKHHDGFCLFDSAYSDYKITNTPYGKDIVKLLADACSLRNMPLGFYYSPPDMNHPGYRDTSKPAMDNWNGQPERPEWSSYLNYMQLQLSELLTRYGDCKVIWFDGLSKQQKYDGQRFLKLIRSLQPETLVNDRIGIRGDFVTPEQYIPKGILTKDVSLHDSHNAGAFHPGIPRAEDFQLWESCMTINHTWGYNANDHDYKSPQELIRALIEVASRGGNFLLNIGPQPDGLIQPEFQDRLRAIGAWLNVNGDSIYESTYGPIQGQQAFRTTARGNSVYLHVFDWHPGSLRVSGVKPKVMYARLLATNQGLQFTQDESGLTIAVPQTAPDSQASVIELKLL